MKDVIIKDIKRKTNVDRSVLMKAAILAYAKLNDRKSPKAIRKVEKVA